MSSDVTQYKELTLKEIICPKCKHTSRVLISNPQITRCLWCESIIIKNKVHNFEYHNYYYYKLFGATKKGFNIMPSKRQLVELIQNLVYFKIPDNFKSKPKTLIYIENKICESKFTVINMVENNKFKFEMKELRLLYEELVKCNYPLAKSNIYSYCNELSQKYKIKLNNNNLKFLYNITSVSEQNE